MRSHRIEGPDGDPVLTATVLVPKPDHDWARHALDTAIERLEDMTRLVSDWIWETNRNLVLTFVSPRVNEVLGYHQVELTGRALSDKKDPPDTIFGRLSDNGRSDRIGQNGLIQKNRVTVFIFRIDFPAVLDGLFHRYGRFADLL